jgi:hypothetical protein
LAIVTLTISLQNLNKKKVTLKELQSLAGSLALCTRALTAGRTFIRQICICMGKVRKSFHFIKVTNALKYDLLVWIQFLDNFNGITYIRDITLSDFDDLLFIIKTTAALSQWNNIFLFLNSLPQRKIANAIGMSSR